MNNKKMIEMKSIFVGTFGFVFSSMDLTKVDLQEEANKLIEKFITNNYPENKIFIKQKRIYNGYLYIDFEREEVDDEYEYRIRKNSEKIKRAIKILKDNGIKHIE